MRKLLIAANWKMYKTPAEAQSFLHTFVPLVKNVTHSEIVICPPFVDLPATAALGEGLGDHGGRAEHALCGRGRLYR